MLVSQFCLGAWHLPGTGQLDSYGVETVDKDEFKRIIGKAYDAGINFIDTSNRYHGRMENSDTDHVGYSEKLLGEILKDYERESLVITTKVRGKMAPWPNGEGLSRKHIMWQMRESLKRLQLDYVDLYQIHWDDPSTPKLETLRTLSNLVDRGFTHYIGESNHAAADIVEFMDLSRLNGLHKFISLQEQYNLLDRQIEADKIGVAKKFGLSLMAYSPLAEGTLTGRYSKGIEKGSRASYAAKIATQYLHSETFEALTHLQQVAKEKQLTLSQLALAWLLHKQTDFGITIVPLLGITKLAHLEENLSALDVSLSGDDMKTLETIASKAKVVPTP
jgi:1-deoxyxylulose-5-phosphate synthase